MKRFQESLNKMELDGEADRLSNVSFQQRKKSTRIQHVNRHNLAERME